MLELYHCQQEMRKKMREIFSTAPAIRAAAFYLRYHVFVLEQKILPELEFDEWDTPDRFYLVFFQEDLPVATVRYQKSNPETLNPDRLCVHSDYRNQGLGTKLLNQVESRAAQEGCQYSILSAELSAQLFYEKRGYRVISANFEEDGVPCVKMQKELRSK